MAAGITAQAVLDKISKGLECPICFNRFMEPKGLNCMHSFCLKCLKELVKQYQEQDSTRVKCPVCRHETMLSGESIVDDLPDNFALASLVDDVNMMEQQLKGQRSEIKCQACDEENRATALCVDCDHFLCQECQRAHGHTSSTKSHKIYTMAQIRSQEIAYNRLVQENKQKLELETETGGSLTSGQLVTKRKWALRTEIKTFGPEHTQFRSACDVAIFSNNEIVVADTKHKRLIKSSTTCSRNSQSEVVTETLQINGLANPSHVLVNKDGQLIVLDGPAVKTFSRQYQFLRQFKPGGPNNAPTCLAVDENNLIAVGYEDTEEISLHSPHGALIKTLPAPKICKHLTLWNQRLIYTSFYSRKLLSFDYHGSKVFSVKVTGDMHSYCQAPNGLCCDRDGSIYVAVRGRWPSGAILHFSPDGVYMSSMIARCGPPGGIALTPDGQNLVVATANCLKIFHRI